MGVLIFVIIITIGLWFVLFHSQKRDKNLIKPITHEIQQTSTIDEMITSIDYGRVYPFYTGMSVIEVKDLSKYSYVGKLKIKELPDFINLENLINPYIDSILLEFNENNVINSIIIVIKDYTQYATQIKELMIAKFGPHTPSNGRCICWRDMRMIIRIDEIDGCIEVLYYKLGQ